MSITETHEASSINSIHYENYIPDEDQEGKHKSPSQNIAILPQLAWILLSPIDFKKCVKLSTVILRIRHDQRIKQIYWIGKVTT
jgi:hypothetical protein